MTPDPSRPREADDDKPTGWSDHVEVDEVAGGADSSPFEATPSGEKKAEAERRLEEENR